MQPIFISIKQLEFNLARKQILRGISADIRKGEIVAIVGANGSGKSTLLKLLAGLLKPVRGEIYIENVNKNLIGYAPDTPPLYQLDTVASYLKFIAALKQIPKQYIQQRIDTCLNIFELTKYHNHVIATLSKGIQQRINLAQAIIHQPQLLILDEPTNGLDPQQCDNFANYLKNLQQQNTTIILSSHNYTEIIKVCDYTLKIYNGMLQKVNKVYDRIDCTA